MISCSLLLLLNIISVFEILYYTDVLIFTSCWNFEFVCMAYMVIYLNISIHTVINNFETSIQIIKPYRNKGATGSLSYFLRVDQNKFDLQYLLCCRMLLILRPKFKDEKNSNEFILLWSNKLNIYVISENLN